jgi:enterochelin esterase-like enzyme
MPPRDPRNRPLDVSQSPAIETLRKDLASGDGAALRDFWRGVEAMGTPLIEEIRGDPQHRVVTFLWRDDCETESVLISANKFTDPGVLEQSLMRRLDGTDVWHRSYRVRSDWRASYTLCPLRHTSQDARPAWPPPELEEEIFAVLSPAHRPAVEEWWRRTAHAVPDPLNPRQIRSRLNGPPSSVIELPGAPEQRWWGRREDVAGGEVVEHRFRSRALGNERRVWVYTPAGYRREEGPYALLILLDGDVWGEGMPVRHTLDNLIAEEKAPPLIAVMPEALDMETRTEELTCNEGFVEFLMAELLPWATERWNVTGDPARTVIAGQSFGGLTSAFAAFRAPERFGNVLSQSGSFWWMNGTEFDAGAEWLTRRYALSPTLPVRFYLEVGLQEWALLGPTRHLRTVLEAKGYHLDYAEYNGGHDDLCWRGGIAEGLVSLLGSPKNNVQERNLHDRSS